MKIPQTLRDRLREGKVIPFVGAGVSMAVTNRDTGERLFPSWRELLLRSADRLDREHKSNPAGLVRSLMSMGRAKDYLSAAEDAREALGPVWFRFLKDQFDPARKEATDESLALARLVWGMNSNLVVTTNYDNVLRWAHPSGVDVKVWDIQAVAEQADLLQGGVRHPTVWHLHGHIDDAGHLILTPGGYALLYPDDSNSKVRYEAALQTLRTLLASRSFLFIGFSMDDEQLSRELERMQEVFEGASGPHYVLVREAEQERVRAYGIPVEILTYSDFGQPLLDALIDLGKVANEAAAPPAPPISSQPDEIPPKVEGGSSAPAPVFFVPFLPKGADVVGREAALQAVRKQLVEGRRTQIGQTAAFQGLGGLGKTQLAVEYAYRYRDEYPGGVIWLTADQDIDAQLTELAPKAGWIAAESEHKYKLDVAMQRLRIHSGLLVFDNVESREAIEAYLPPRQTGAHILLTSRTEQQDFIPVPLDVLDPEQSVELLTREAGREPQGAAEEEALREIANRLGGLPLALELAGAFIRHREIGWGLYRDRLNRNPRAALTGRFLQSFTEHESDLYSTLQIDEEVFEDEPLLTNVLDVLAWSGPAPMGISLLAALLAVDDPTDLTEALGLGVALRLIQKTPGTDSYSIHRLVSEVWRETHPISLRTEWVEANCSRLGAWFQDRKENFLDLPAFEVEIDHLRAWHESAVAAAPDHMVRLLWLQAYPPYHRGQFRTAQDFVGRALSVMEARATSDKVLLADLLHDFAFTSAALGESRKSLEYEERALSIRTELFGELHPDTSISLGSIAGLYNKLGDYQKDLEYAERALRINAELFGERHPATAASLDSVGNAYTWLGEYKKALEYSERALGIRTELLGERHPDTAQSLESVAGIYSKLGNYQKDLEYADRALRIRAELFGERHPKTATSLGSVGVTYNSRGEYENALEYAQRGLAIFQDLFGERHPDTVKALNNVGSAYKGLGDYRKALEYQERALTISQDLLGDQHLSTGIYHGNVGDSYNRLGDYRKGLEQKQRALAIRRQVHGETHSETVDALVSVAVTLVHLGERAEALALLHNLSCRLDRNHPRYFNVKQHLHSLSREAVRPGFRQQTAGKQNPGKKRKPKKKR